MHDNYTGANPGLGAIAKLPVFLDLRRKKAVLVGGGPGLAWKAELIASAGAEVTVIAPDEVSPELEALIRSGVPDGSLSLHRRPWQPGDLEGAVLAIGDFADRDEAARFHDAAKAANALVNTIDKPATCDFYFGSIVSRSPVMVGISTDGTAPILGQAIRLRIEAALPTWLADWARLGGAMRPRVKASLKPGTERRRFWERLAHFAFLSPPAAESLGELEQMIGGKPAERAGLSGRVTMVEIASDDPDLLTMKTVRTLQSADILLAGADISPAVLALARREATLMAPDADKSPDRHAEALAADGKQVVWLRKAG